MELIAEIGWNHMGDMELAEKMIKAAHDAGADYAKFQTWNEINLTDGPWDIDGRREIYKKAQLSLDQFLHLRDYCQETGIKFLTSVFNVADVKAMASVSCRAIKIPSPEVANHELLVKCANSFEKIYLSTGACTEGEIDQAIEILNGAGVDFVIMHCVSMYPCADEKVNLPRISKLAAKHSKIGFSDHTPDNLSAILAMPMGIVAIEKHFTTDNDLPGRDNKFALLPPEFKEISSAAQRFLKMTVDLGIDYQKEEQEVRDVYRGRWNKKT